MKIGIFTFHRASNYGAVLQAYALQEYLSSQGYETCVVDYVPPVMGKLFCSMKVKGIYSKLKRLAVNIIYLPHILLRIKRRNLFALLNYMSFVMISLLALNPTKFIRYCLITI